MLIGSSALITRIVVLACSRAGRLLTCLGDRCTTTTKAMPESPGIFSKKLSSGVKPPAEAPMPTTGNLSVLGTRSDSCSVCGDISAVMQYLRIGSMAALCAAPTAVILGLAPTVPRVGRPAPAGRVAHA